MYEVWLTTSPLIEAHIGLNSGLDLNQNTDKWIVASGMVRNHNSESLKLFDELLKSGVCREQARGVLPQNLYTKYYGTTSLHNLLKFVSLRIHEGAQWEIQQVAKACLEIAKTHFPHSVDSYMKHKMEE